MSAASTGLSRGLRRLPANQSPFLMAYVSEYPVSQQAKGPGVPKQVKDIDGLFQRSLGQHPYLLHDMRLGKKRRKAKKQGKWDEKPVVERIFHDFKDTIWRTVVWIVSGPTELSKHPAPA